MRFMPRAVVALSLFLASPAAAQTDPVRQVPPSIGTSIPASVIDALPIGDSVYALLETTQSEVIADRFNSGGLNVGGDTRVGGFLGSWSQTVFRIGDVNISDPSGSGSALLFPGASLWTTIDVATGLMPASVNTPGLAVILEPRRAGTHWTSTFSGSGSGGGLAADAAKNQPIPIMRLSDYGHATALVSGPISPRTSLVTAGSWSRGSSFTRERLAETPATTTSVFSHLVFEPSRGREWRLLGWAQRSESPLASWTLFANPSATTGDTAVHVQSTLENRTVNSAAWRVFGGYTERRRDNAVGATTATLDRIVDGPVAQLVDSTADTTTRRLAAGARLSPLRDSSATHHIDLAADLDIASVGTSNQFTGLVQEYVDTTFARIWSYSAPADTSRRRSATAALYATDRISLSQRATLDAGIRAEFVHGRAQGASTAVSWFSLLPHVILRWKAGNQRTLTLGYTRSAHSLNLSWLAFGDPAGLTADVASVNRPGTVVAEVGPGTGGSNDFSKIDGTLKRPVTDELIIGWERRRSDATRYTLTGIARWETNMLGVVNAGVPGDSYASIGVPDAGKDLVNPDDDRVLLFYDRRPDTFGQDRYLVTNPSQDAASAFALRMSLEHTRGRLFLLFGATASAAMGSVSNRGYGPLENDQDQPGERFTNPNAASYARGRLFADRAFTIKWTTVYRLPGDVTVAGIARYQDGQPFSRMVIAPQLSQGAEAVQAYPNAGSRYTFTGTLDLRVQKGFRAGRARVDALLDAYNLFTRNNEVEEYVVSGDRFRTSTAIQPPHAVHVGLRLSF